MGGCFFSFFFFKYFCTVRETPFKKGIQLYGQNIHRLSVQHRSPNYPTHAKEFPYYFQGNTLALLNLPKYILMRKKFKERNNWIFLCSNSMFISSHLFIVSYDRLRGYHFERGRWLIDFIISEVSCLKN